MNHLLFTAVAMLWMTVAIQELAAAPPVSPEPPIATTASPLRSMVWDEALDAGTNVRYWSTMSERAESKEWWAAFGSIVSGLFVFAFPYLIAPHLKAKKWRWLTVGVPEIIGVVAFGFSLMSMFEKSETHQELTSIHGRWATLKPELDELFDVSHTLTEDELELRFDALQKAKQAIVPIEPAETDEDLMHQSWREEMHARNRDDWVAQVDAKNHTQNN